MISESVVLKEVLCTDSSIDPDHGDTLVVLLYTVRRRTKAAVAWILRIAGGWRDVEFLCL